MTSWLPRKERCGRDVFFYQRCFSELYCSVEIKSLKENVTQFNLGLMFFCVNTVDVDLPKVLSGY